jgi:hypothetical protein
MNASGPGGNTPGGAAGGIDLFHNQANASWPLIRFLMDDPNYRQTYRGYVEELLDTVFEPNALAARLQAEQARIQPYVIGPEGETTASTFLSSPAEFTQAAASLTAYVRTRAAAVRQALETSR